MPSSLPNTERKLTAKQEAFCVNYVALNNGKLAAIKAGYSERTAKAIAYENLTKLYLNERIAELRATLPRDPDIATVEERQKRLTEFIRADLMNFIDKNGTPTLTKDIPNAGAVAEYAVRQTQFGESRSIKLQNPISAIAELNKMGGDYAPEKHVIAAKVIFEVAYREKPKE